MKKNILSVRFDKMCSCKICVGALRLNLYEKALKKQKQAVSSHERHGRLSPESKPKQNVT